MKKLMFLFLCIFCYIQSNAQMPSVYKSPEHFNGNIVKWMEANFNKETALEYRGITMENFIRETGGFPFHSFTITTRGNQVASIILLLAEPDKVKTRHQKGQTGEVSKGIHIALLNRIPQEEFNSLYQKYKIGITPIYVFNEEVYELMKKYVISHLGFTNYGNVGT